MFADDTAVYIASWRIRLAIEKIQIYLEVLIEYFDRWKLKINIEESELIIFFFKSDKNLLSDLYMKGITVIPDSSGVHLGLTLCSTLKCNKQIEQIKKKAARIIGFLNCLIDRKSKLVIKNKLIIYKAIAKPLITYTFYESYS